jgi:hypothetical protein
MKKMLIFFLLILVFSSFASANLHSVVVSNLKNQDSFVLDVLGKNIGSEVLATVNVTITYSDQTQESYSAFLEKEKEFLKRVNISQIIKTVNINYYENLNLMEKFTFDFSEMQDLISQNAKFAIIFKSQKDGPMFKNIHIPEYLQTGFNLQDAGTTVNYDMDSMTAQEDDPGDNECSQYSEWADEEYDKIDETYYDWRPIFGADLSGIPSGKVIYEATAHIYADEVADDVSFGDAEDLIFYAARATNSDCDMCMDWNNAFESDEDCDIRDEDESVLTIDDLEIEDYVDHDFNIDVTGMAREAHKNTYKKFYVWADIDADSDDYACADLHGEDHSSYYPTLTVKYKDPECNPSDPCCDSWGLYRSNTHKCQDNVETIYGCPWGTQESSNVGKKYKDKYCSGSSGQCNGALILEDSWITQENCGELQKCLDGQNSCADVTCFNNEDCGTDGFNGENTKCKYDSNKGYYNVYENKIEHTCFSEGETWSSCSSSTNLEEKQDCGTSEAIGDWSAPHCSEAGPNGILIQTRNYIERGCGNAECYQNPILQTQTDDDCDYGCQNNECVTPACFNSNDCDPDGNSNNNWLGEPFCDDNSGDIFQLKNIYSCNQAGTFYANCPNPTTDTVMKTNCAYGCLQNNGNPVCDPNGAPEVQLLVYQDPKPILRATQLDLKWFINDPNGWNDISSYEVGFKDDITSDWEIISDVNYQYYKPGTKGLLFADIQIPVDASLDDNYHLYCSVTDSGGKNDLKYYYYAFEVVDHPLEFTIPVQDHTTLLQPAIAGEEIHFTTHIEDPDSTVELHICDEQGKLGNQCKGEELCSDGFKTQGEFHCDYDTTGLSSDSYDWTSFAVNDLGDITVGDSGTFYVIDAPLNPSLNLEGEEIWSHSGYFDEEVVVSNFESTLQDILDDCTPNEGGTCDIEMSVESGSAGFLEISELAIEYYLVENVAPQLFTIDDIIVNEGDLITIEPQAYDYDGDEIAYSISEPVGDDGVWQTTEFDDGIYEVTVTASDEELTDELIVAITVNELIDPSVGGTIEYEDVKMTVYAGSLPADEFTDIQINEADETDYIEENNLKVVGKVYQFSPSGAQFNVPIKVEISYDDTEIEDEGNLDAWLYKLIDEEEQLYKWTPLGAEVHADENVLVFYLTHFSTYALHEVMDDLNPPEIEITSPESKSYNEPNAELEFTVTDERDPEPVVIVYLDDEVIEQNEFDMGLLSIGEHEIKISATDMFGNQANQSVEFFINDLEVPITTAKADENIWFTEPQLIELTSSKENAETYYCVDQLNSCYPISLGNEVLVDQDGINYIRYYSSDGANQEPIKESIVKLDLNEPDSYIENYEDVETIELKEPSILTLIPFDSASGVSNFYCTIDEEDCPENYEFEINQEKTYVLTFFATDLVGNMEDEKTLLITLDSISPITVKSPETYWLNKDQNSINFGCEDQGSGCKKVFFTETLDNSIIVKNGLNFDIDFSYAEDDVVYHNIAYQSMDNFGNTEELKQETIGVDDIDPIVNIENYQDGSSVSSSDVIEFEISLEDFESGSSHYEMYVNDNLVEVWPQDAYDVFEEGENVVSVVGYDSVGNSAELSIEIIMEQDPCFHSVDQSQLISNAGYSSSNFLGQTFMIGEDSVNLDRIDLKSYTDKSDVSQIKIKLYEKVTQQEQFLIAESEFGKSLGEKWFRFDFIQEFELEPGESYYFSIEPEMAFSWAISETDTYSSGEAYSSYQVMFDGNRDFVFKTYSITTECSDSLCADVFCSNSCNVYDLHEIGCSYGECVETNIVVNSTNCGWQEPACFGDVDCSYLIINDHICEENSLIHTYTEPSCSEKGTPLAQCLENLKQENEVCEFGCENGLCKEDPCKNVVCNPDQCEGFNWVHSGSCSEGICNYQTEENSEQCGWPPACFNDDDCLDLGYSNEPYCDENEINLLDTFTSSICVNPGTVEAQCADNSTAETLNECQYGCYMDHCKGICDDVKCNDYCDELGSWYNNGICFEGDCQYSKKTEAEECSWEEPSCYTNEDCGTDGWLNELYCSEDEPSVFDTFVMYFCMNPGMSDAHCINTTDPKSVENCEETCVNAECVDACYNVTCEESCEDYTWIYDGICVEGACHYLEEENAEECGWSKPICFKDEDCSDSFWDEENECVEGDIYDYETTYTCQEAGTSDAYCEEETNFTFKEECNLDCVEGECVDLCQYVVCKDHCDGYDLLSNLGCLAGECQYETTTNSSLCKWGVGWSQLYVSNVEMLNPEDLMSKQNNVVFKMTVENVGHVANDVSWNVVHESGSLMAESDVVIPEIQSEIFIYVEGKPACYETLTFTIDPDNTIEETVEEDNSYLYYINTHNCNNLASSVPDLEISKVELIEYNNPMAIFKVIMKNVGSFSAENIVLDVVNKITGTNLLTIEAGANLAPDIEITTYPELEINCNDLLEFNVSNSIEENYYSNNIKDYEFVCERQKPQRPENEAIDEAEEKESWSAYKGKRVEKLIKNNLFKRQER